MASRTFGSLEWDCVTPGSHWIFDDGWGRFHLRHFNNRGQAAGWYFDTPEESGDWMGNTLAEAAEEAEPLILDPSWRHQGSDR